jgi:hypothetical protein
MPGVPGPGVFTDTDMETTHYGHIAHRSDTRTRTGGVIGLHIEVRTYTHLPFLQQIRLQTVLHSGLHQSHSVHRSPPAMNWLSAMGARTGGATGSGVLCFPWLIKL